MIKSGNNEDMCTKPAPGNDNNVRLFQDERRWAMFWLVVACLVVYYSIPIMYVIYHRNQAAIRTRSPFMIVIVVLCLMCDSIINLTLFTLDPIKNG